MLGSSAATKALGASMKARQATITAAADAAAAGVLMPVPANATEVLAAAAAIEGAAAAHCQEWLKSFAPSGNGFPYFSVREALVSPFASEGRVLFLCVQVSPPNLFYGAKTIFKGHYERKPPAPAHILLRVVRGASGEHKLQGVVTGPDAERVRAIPADTYPEDATDPGNVEIHLDAHTDDPPWLPEDTLPTTRGGYGDYRLRGSTASRYVVRAVVPGRRFESMPARYAPGAQPPGYTKATYRQAAHWTPSSTTIGSWWRRGRPATNHN